MSNPGADFVAGAIAMGYVVLGLFFFRFWRRTRDKIFIYFGVAFWLLAINASAATLTHVEETEAPWVYLIRLAAFIVIAAGIVRKNLSPTSRL